MATSVKTVEFIASSVITTLASATLRALTGATSIYIPEADSGTIFSWKSATLEVTLAEDSSTIASLTSPTIGIKLGAAAFDSVVLAAPVGNSGEGEVWHFTRDVLSYFQTNWVTGTTSNPWYVNITVTGPVTANHVAKLIITYQYDDTKSTQIKTIWIPIESTRGLLTTTAQTVGGATAIPANLLRTYLPETGTTVRQAWLEMWGNESCTSNGAFTAQARIGGVGGALLNLWRSPATGPSSSRWAYSAYDITTYPQLSATTALSLECLVLTTTSRMNNYGGLIGVTYEFNATGSTTIYNSLKIGGIEQTGWMGGTIAADADTWSRNIYIEEPGTITIKESGALVYCMDSATFTMSINVSGQTTQTNLFTIGSLMCGIFSAVHRIDAGGRAGNGMTLVRGKNVYTLLISSGTANSGWNVNAALLLNYTSSKHTNGVSAHAHSCHQLVFGNTTAGVATSQTLTGLTITPTIPETYYYLVGMLLYSTYTLAATTYNAFAIQHEIQPTEGVGDGWLNIYAGMARAAGENVNGVIYCAARNNYKRWLGDPDPDRANLKTGRRFRIDMLPGAYINLAYWYTYNSITYTVSGTCTGFSGNGSGINVDIYRIIGSTEEHLLSLTTIAGGTFSELWIDNTDTLYAAAQQDSTHVGSSINGTAG